MAYELVASIVQRLECKPSKLEMRVRFPLLAPRNFVIARKARLRNFSVPRSFNEVGQKIRLCF